MPEDAWSAKQKCWCLTCLRHVQLLSELGWNALSATTLHFSQCYISRGVHCEGDALDGFGITACDRAIIHKHMESFATYICLQGVCLRVGWWVSCWPQGCARAWF
jgi:hypothetical protein